MQLMRRDPTMLWRKERASGTAARAGAAARFLANGKHERELSLATKPDRPPREQRCARVFDGDLRAGLGELI